MKKKTVLITAASILVLLIGVFAARISYVYFNTQKWTNLMLPGITVNGEDISGKTKGEALEILKNKFGNEVLKKKVVIKAPNKEYAIDYSKLSAKYNIEDTVNEALKYSDSFGMFQKHNIIKKPQQKNYILKFTYDKKNVDETITAMEKDINKEPVNAILTMSSPGVFSIAPDKKGAKLKSEELKKELEKQINGELAGNVLINAPIEELTASVTGDKLTAVNTLVSSYSTDFSTSSDERASNVVLATRSINGKVLMPGESFSFNTVVGERTKDRGYKDAPVIVGNKIESGIGGGICQVSSTLHNAVVRTDIKSIERVHHTFPSSYVPKGLDATVDWGNIDYKFTNTLNFPVYIEGTAVNRTLRFNIYSNSSLTSRKFEVYSEVYETVSADTKEIMDSSLYEGVRVTDQKPYTGYRVKVYKKTIENGQVISNEIIGTDYYKRIDGVVRVGTKKRT